MSVGPSLEHLPRYYDFEPDVLARVSEAAERQHQVPFLELAKKYDIEEGASIYFDSASHKFTEYLLLKNEGYTPDTPHSVLFAPMNTPVDENMAMRAIRLQASMPERPLVVIGSPNARPESFHLIAPQAVSVIEHPSIVPFTPSAAKLIRLISPEIEALLGYSLGADMAAGVAARLAHEGVEVTTSVLVESPATRRRTLLRLLADFKSSEPPLDAYIAHSDSIALGEARSLAEQPLSKYARGMLSLTNIALARVLADGLFADRVNAALDAQHTMHAVVGWGTESELTRQADAARAVARIKNAHGPRAHEMELHGMHHAGADDINLHAAMMLQGISIASIG